MLKPQRLDREERKEHQRRSTHGPVDDKEGRQDAGFARAEQQEDSASNACEGEGERQPGSDAVRDESAQDLAHAVQAEGEAQNDRRRRRRVSDSEQIDDELGENSINREGKEKTCERDEPEGARPDGLGDGKPFEPGCDELRCAGGLRSRSMTGWTSFNHERDDRNYYQHDG